MSEDQLQPADTLDDRGVDDVLDEGYSPPDREPAHLRHPPTDASTAAGETLDERLAQEEPEPDPYAVADREPGPEDPHRSTGASAEEAAVHVIAEDEVGPETEPDRG